MYILLGLRISDNGQGGEELQPTVLGVFKTVDDAKSFEETIDYGEELDDIYPETVI